MFAQNIDSLYTRCGELTLKYSLQDPVWYNMRSLLPFNNSSLSKGIKIVKDFLHPKGELMSRQELIYDNNVKCNFPRI